MIQRKRAVGFWVILAGATPTSFRARNREDLLPTLYQLQRTQSDVTLQWFERNRLWPSPADARQALLARRARKPGRPAGWRPGGEHRDRRERFQLTRDQKRARFKARQRRAGPTRPKPPGHKPRGSR